MECNKEEALRAKEIAEKKMQSMDFLGARNIAIKAQKLFPELESISQMITVCDVHCSSAVKISGSESDWYGILKVEQMADEATIRKQFRKLALLLHPDKNKFPGSEAAFKLIVEAHKVLTDRTNRSLYDMKRRMNVTAAGTKQAPPHLNRNTQVRQQSDIQNNFTSKFTPQFPGMNQQQAGNRTFWTSCPFCNMKYQYYQNIMDRAISCQNCQKTFVAYDVNTRPGVNSVHGFNPSEIHKHRQEARQGVPWARSHVTAKGASVSKTEIDTHFGGRSQSKAAVGGYAAERSFYEEAKLKKVNAHAHSRKKGRKRVIESSESCDTDTSDEDEVNAGHAVESTRSCHPRRSTRQKQQVTYREDESGSDDDDFDFHYRSKMSRRGKSAGTLREQMLNDTEHGVEPGGGSLFDDAGKGKHRGSSCDENLPNEKEQSEACRKRGKQQSEDSENKRFKGEDSIGEDTDVNLVYKNSSNLDPNSSTDSIFHDFEADRVHSTFAVGQIWAVYDTNECMPRFYASIKKIRLESSMLDVTWLEPCIDPDDHAVASWVEADLPIACGDFILATGDETEMCSFSHLVSWESGKETGVYKIYPRKGDIWALFKDWNINWCYDPDKHREHSFEVVEILSDYDSRSGFEVARLVKLKGFASLFHRAMDDKNNCYQIPPHELLRFSHRIPHYRMTGKERKDVPEGSCELDPASLPIGMEEMEILPFKNSHNITSDFGAKGAQVNGLCSKSNENYENKKKTMKSVGPTEKNVQDMSDLDDKLSTQTKTNDPSEKKKQVDNTKENRDSFLDNKQGEANLSQNHTEERKHLDNVDDYSDNSDNNGHCPPMGENIEYPDPEFYAFEAHKSEDRFQSGQIWALYSDTDSLPNFYGLIKKVSSMPFEIEMSWLEACRPLEGEIRWSDRRLPIGCGKFSVKHQSQTYQTTQIFSHLVEADATSRTRYSIYPLVAEIWAVYKNLSVDWTSSDMETCEYDIGRIIDNTGSGLRVAVLEKVGGYNSVFKDAGVMVEIPQNELLRFSHRIPAFQLTEERGGKLRGYWELDPAAVPPILFCTSYN